MATNKSLIQARYAFALLRIAKTSDREAALRLLAGLVGDRPLPGVKQELANLHHDAIEAFGSVIDVLQTGSSVAVPPWNAALDATNRWLGTAGAASPERRSDAARSAAHHFRQLAAASAVCDATASARRRQMLRFDTV